MRQKLFGLTVAVACGIVGAMLVGGTAAWAASAQVTTPATGGLPMCQANLNTCTANLATCTADLGTCDTDLAQAQGDLSTCNTNLGISVSNLNTCNGNLSQAQTGLSTCTTDLVACLAATAAFPATGQTTAYTADKNDGVVGVVSVPDDGTVQAGATLSYTDNGDGTITDNNTGLMWEKKLAAADASCTSGTQSLRDLRCVNNFYRWSWDGSQETIWDWLDDLNASNFGGHSDWRIPNVRELQSIVNYRVFNPSISAVFMPTSASLYWSSTTVASGTSRAWGVSFSGGVVGNDGKVSGFFVRAVRGGS